VCSATADADFFFPDSPLNILCSRGDFADLEWGRGNAAALFRMVSLFLEVKRGSEPYHIYIPPSSTPHASHPRLSLCLSPPSSLSQVECVPEAFDGTPAGALLRRDPFVTYHVISSLFDELFRRQKDHPHGELPLDTHECLGVMAWTVVERLLAVCPEVARFRTEPLGASNDSADSAVLSMPPLSGACEMLLHVASSFRGHFGACMVAQLHEVRTLSRRLSSETPI